MLRKLACMAAISTAWWLSTAAALGLGDIEVKSRLNQKFSASIPLIAATAESAEGLQISLAGNDDYARAGVERSEFVSTLQFEVKLDGAVPRIEVSSKQIARDPYMVFLIDVRNQRTRLLREYTVLLDPPATQKSPLAAPVVTNNAAQFFEAPGDQPVTPAKPARPAVAAAPPPPAAIETPGAEAPEQMPAAAPVVAAEGQYGPVQPGETLWSIAARLRASPAVSMDQIMLALHGANPSAFAGGSINGLLKGAMLRVPSADEQRAVPAGEARVRVAQLRGVPVAEPPARPVSPPPVVAPPPQAVEPRPEPTPAPPPPSPRPAPAEPSAVPTPESMSPSSAEPAPQPSETPPVPAATPPVPEETAVPEPEAEPVPDTALPPEPVAAPPVQVTPEQGLPMELLLAALAFVLVALGGGYYLYRRRKGGGELTSSLSRRPAVQPPEEPVAAAGVVASLSTAPQTSREELERLDETVGEERADLGMPLAPPPPAPRSESLRMDDTLGMTGPLPDNGQTAQFRADPNATQVMEPVSAATAKLAEKVDFDVTGQFESDTVSINLDTNDPVAEADFHLAYGLYDEAALLLQQAAEKDPGNTAVRVKLAEVYFAAGKPAEFEQTAEPLKNELPAAEWQKLAILGQQICPESPVFQDAGGGDLGGAVDLNFDEPAPAAPAASPVPAPARDAGGDAGGGVLDFKLEDFELPSQPEPAATDKPASTPGSSVLEFNLDVPEIKAGIGASPEPEPKAQQSPEPEEPKLELDLGAFDLGSPDLPPPPPAKPKPAAGDGEMKLEDFDVAADSAAIGADDAAGTKLDLARAYLDMGDKDMTKSLLEEVLVQGNAQQKQEAQALMGRLG